MRIAFALIGAFLALLCLVGSIAFGLYALYQGVLLHPAIIAWEAALITAVAACVIALLIVLLMRICWQPRRPTVPRSAKGMESWLEACLSSDMRRTLQHNARGATLTALVLGVTLGGSRQARRTVMQLLRDMARNSED